MLPLGDQALTQDLRRWFERDCEEDEGALAEFDGAAMAVVRKAVPDAAQHEKVFLHDLNLLPRSAAFMSV